VRPSFCGTDALQARCNRIGSPLGMSAFGLRFSTGKGLAALLQSVGLAISEREIQRLLTEKRMTSSTKPATRGAPDYEHR
jgi:hypothetical protein